MNTTLSPEMKQRMVDIICSGKGTLPTPAGLKIEITSVSHGAVGFRVSIVDDEDCELTRITQGYAYEGDTITLLDVNRAFEFKVG